MGEGSQNSLDLGRGKEGLRGAWAGKQSCLQYFRSSSRSFWAEPAWSPDQVPPLANKERWANGPSGPFQPKQSGFLGGLVLRLA